jgi:hypothetical protein
MTISHGTGTDETFKIQGEWCDFASCQRQRGSGYLGWWSSTSPAMPPSANHCNLRAGPDPWKQLLSDL